MNAEVAEPTLSEDASSQFYGEPETVLDESETTETELENAQEPEAVQTEENETETSDASEDQDQPNVELSTIAQALGLDENDLDLDENGQVVVNAKIDGQESKAKVKDFLATYQKQGHLDNRLREVNEREENLKAQETNFQGISQQKLQQSEDLNRIALSALHKESQQIDWAWLKENDPTDFLLKQQEYRSREGQIKQALDHTAKQREDAEAQNRALEAQKVVKLMPGWNNPDVAKKEESEITAYITENKMNPDIANYADVYLLAKKAKAYDDLQNSQPEITKLVKSAPKVSKRRSPAKPAETPKSDADYFY